MTLPKHKPRLASDVLEPLDCLAYPGLIRNHGNPMAKALITPNPKPKEKPKFRVLGLDPNALNTPNAIRPHKCKPTTSTVARLPLQALDSGHSSVEDAHGLQRC